MILFIIIQLDEVYWEISLTFCDVRIMAVFWRKTCFLLKNMQAKNSERNLKITKQNSTSYYCKSRSYNNFSNLI